ncbi:MAG: 50S ribosomal protein L2 [Candidatus Wildermuthbacteria bacterium RIFCSPHIGHO2_01_FULL_48_25]|uniref:Large ribosomal subunit protein uL2 n=1 Tax=Candidatus Wildermuthbacteria bacterium RIFCSPLOWO2_01_FULL_48_16 TaxID=1802461 RepID=A0A1G2RMG7_9BACT|nr:MAG: 50S ribosomal protein L2 [Candidatus Wildermuthbacteria bacterium RIFCSPHIGHO2_01_FULL_48_25]OHA69072.1 MAG: 50S ribosomal protein L2 [Candidatus Wildermuthbacteria bacterium RIFCSPHIGHO2_02_FULL_49_12b]OHA73482.1 MAG: 50S ribosomal protein L2 [Candidatus Wildermuthbacteria bacterium RIFCSPLOWO2_01_FULL_48_16]
MKTILSKKEPEKRLLVHMRNTGGRNKYGRITVRHRGGGTRSMYRFVDFGQEYAGVKGKVSALEYDPNRNAFIALVQYENGKKGYVLAAETMKEGSEILCDERAEVASGNRMRLQYIPVGTQVFNIELIPNQGGKIVRGAGTAAIIGAHESGFAQLTLPSTEVRRVSDQCFATVGMVSNPGHKYVVLGKAGRRRLKGWRPSVRGTAMNPHDHPHGGGEGKTGRGMTHPKTPWGKPALGVKTRGRKWTDKLIVSRRKKKKK